MAATVSKGTKYEVCTSSEVETNGIQINFSMYVIMQYLLDVHRKIAFDRKKYVWYTIHQRSSFLLPRDRAIDFFI